jgi:hypothetical protein
MKSSDLRIGKFIYHEVDLHDIKGVWKERIYINHPQPDSVAGSYSTVASNISGVPLDHSWLTVFGFESNGEEVWWIGDFYIQDLDNGEYAMVECKGQIKNFKYLHELQNAYHALTGKELKNKAYKK